MSDFLIPSAFSPGDILACAAIPEVDPPDGWELSGDGAWWIKVLSGETR